MDTQTAVTQITAAAQKVEEHAATFARLTDHGDPAISSPDKVVMRMVPV
jgi:hypothetical protein